MRSKMQSLLGSAVLSATLALSQPASATLGELLGDWHNVNASTRDIVRLEATEFKGAIDVHIWGACTPNPCDWGTVRAAPFAPNVETKLPAGAQYLLADFNPGFAKVTVIIGPSPNPGGELRLIELTHFTDNSGRSDFATSDLFKK
jgi:hypothetical protein